MTKTEQCRRWRNKLFVHRRAGTLIGGLTGCHQIILTKKAATTGNYKGYHHAIAFFYRRDVSAHFFDNPHKFMTKNIAFFGRRDFATV